MNAVILILSDDRGLYIPRDFICNTFDEVDVDHCATWGLTESNKTKWQDAVHPAREGYWDAWQWILDNAKFTDSNGDVFTLYQEGDLWGLCVDLMSDEEKSNFGFED